MDEPFVLIVGAADTGRAPISVALLRRLAEQRGLTGASNRPEWSATMTIPPNPRPAMRC